MALSTAVSAQAPTDQPPPMAPLDPDGTGQAGAPAGEGGGPLDEPWAPIPWEQTEPEATPDEPTVPDAPESPAALDPVAPAAPPWTPPFWPCDVPLQFLVEELPYADGQPVPPCFRVHERIRWRPTIGGIVLLSTTHSITAVTAATTWSWGAGSGVAALLVPVAGPFIALGTIEGATEGFGWIIGIPMIVDGLAQTAGVILIVVGASTTQPVLMRTDVGASEVGPQLRLRGQGIDLVQRF